MASTMESKPNPPSWDVRSPRLACRDSFAFFSALILLKVIVLFVGCRDHLVDKRMILFRQPRFRDRFSPFRLVFLILLDKTGFDDTPAQGLSSETISTIR
jgi:hypothetical protein